MTLLCSDDKLEQVFYFHEVKGNAIDGSYKASPPRKLHLERYIGYETRLMGWMQLGSRIVRIRVLSTCPRKAVNEV